MTCERKSLRPQGLARMTAEGARGFAAGNARRGGALVSRVRCVYVTWHRTIPYSTVPYHTVSYPAAGTHGKAYLTLSLSKKARGKERRCGKPAKMWKTLWKACGKLVSRRSGRCGRARCWLAAGCGLARAFGRAQSGACFRPVRVWWTLLAGALWRPCGAGRGCSAGRAG